MERGRILFLKGKVIFLNKKNKKGLGQFKLNLIIKKGLEPRC